MGSTNKRPKLSEAVRYFKDVYDHVGKSVPKAGKFIGGKVNYNVNVVADDDIKWKNLCAVRLSYVLNNTGFKIPKQGVKTVSGKNGHWYLYRVNDMIKYLAKAFGKPDATYVAPTPEKLANYKGIVVFEVDSWNDATGHATIWNGIGCSDSCYFKEANKVHLWILKD